ncbi:hypothetical protein [Lysobacter sp. CFH 32150]|uniref:hypothetical protein n=1 Tax=Lysobacter sp. CFH 32150 TaxID=2927128 RepID=UPI001FA7113B|nr:hypothetical protein [Lysobacter sp. CFH 32150]MCI4566637.1 hypothetical protein [Lysobacter sp. CFH 32150]
MFETRTHRLAAAAVAVLYIAIQSFQWFVFSQLPTPDGPAQELLQGPLPLNLARATLMLLSFFGLAYLYLVACVLVFQRKPLAAVAAFLGFFVFCLLELQLRSVELFYVYLKLPGLYEAATAAAEQARLLEIQSIFQSVQYALYFPLGLAQVLGSIALCVALGGNRFDWLAKFAFGLNAVRLLLRMLDTYVLGTRFDALYSTLYLPLVYVIFGAIVAWLCLRRED